MVTAFEVTLRSVAVDLDDLGLRWTLVGGVAVSARSAPRFTKDVDCAIAIADDEQAESVIHQLGSRGYAPGQLIEHEYVDRLATARLIKLESGIAVDLLFANSGIEEEIVAQATSVEVMPDLHLPVASLGHMIALKVLASRHQDFTDLAALIAVATAADLVSHENRSRRSRREASTAGKTSIPTSSEPSPRPLQQGSESALPLPPVVVAARGDTYLVVGRLVDQSVFVGDAP